MPRRLTALLVVALTVVPLLGHGTVAAAAPTVAELDAAEARVEQLVNRRRDSRGKRPLRHDPRVAALARARSQDMVEHDYFAHADRRGRFADYYLGRAGVRFTRVGEIIAWGHGDDVLGSAEEALDLWMHSDIHRRQILKDNNYFGAGVATDGSSWKWTVIFITGSDRTAPRARFTSAGVDGSVVRLRWTGSDPVLATGTAGLRGYDLERRSPGGPWRRIRNATRDRSYVRRHTPGRTFEYRLRARDKAGNRGAWTEPVTLSV